MNGYGAANYGINIYGQAAYVDAATGGNMLAETALTASKPIGSGDVFRFQAGEFDITLT